MTTQEWLEKTRHDADKIRGLIRDFHPSAGARRKSIGPITAQNAEIACERVRQQIAATEAIDPIKRFDKALTDGDVGELISVMNGAWFGVPESTSCWRLEGFTEMVALMEDPPDDDEEDHGA